MTALLGGVLEWVAAAAIEVTLGDMVVEAAPPIPPPPALPVIVAVTPVVTGSKIVAEDLKMGPEE